MHLHHLLNNNPQIANNELHMFRNMQDNMLANVSQKSLSKEQKLAAKLERSPKSTKPVSKNKLNTSATNKHRYLEYQK